MSGLLLKQLLYEARAWACYFRQMYLNQKEVSDALKKIIELHNDSIIILQLDLEQANKHIEYKAGVERNLRESADILQGINGELHDQIKDLKGRIEANYINQAEQETELFINRRRC